MKRTISEICKKSIDLVFLFYLMFFYSGNIEVQVLDQSSVENPNKRFKLSAEVANFNDLKSSKIKRAKYGAFISQRRAVPSKQFIVSSVN